MWRGCRGMCPLQRKNFDRSALPQITPGSRTYSEGSELVMPYDISYGDLSRITLQLTLL